MVQVLLALKIKTNIATLARSTYTFFCLSGKFNHRNLPPDAFCPGKVVWDRLVSAAFVVGLLVFVLDNVDIELGLVMVDFVEIGDVIE